MRRFQVNQPTPGPTHSDFVLTRANSKLLGSQVIFLGLGQQEPVSTMMASIAPPFAGHQASLNGHAGVTHGGLPVSQGHSSNQGVPGVGQQPGVSMGQQMHAGIAGPGAAQVTQAGPLMGSMIQTGIPGAGPSAMALQHLNPAHQGQILTAQHQQQLQHASK